MPALTGDAPFTYLWPWATARPKHRPQPHPHLHPDGVYSATLEVWNCDNAGHDTLSLP